MANKKKTKEDYPIVKYRIVTGNGYSLVEGGEKALKDAIERNKAFVKEYCHDEKSIKRFSIQHIIKVTEEYIELDETL